MQLSTTINQAMVLIGAGKDMEADDLMVKASNKALKKFGENSAQYAQSLQEHAAILLQMNNPYECRDFLQKARELPIAGFEGNKLRAGINSDLGEVLQQLGAHRESADAFEEAWQLMKLCFGEDDIDTADVLLDLAEARLHCGQLTESIGHADQAFEILNKHKSVHTFNAYVIASVARHLLGDLPRRLGLVAAYMHPDDLALLVDRVVDKLGYFDCAAQAAVLERLYNELKELPALPAYSRISLTEQLAFQLGRCEEYEKADGYWRLTFEGGKQSDDIETMISALMEKGKSLARSGDFPRAETELIEALRLAQQSPVREMVPYAMRGYAWIMAKQNRLKDAEDFLRNALRMTRELHNPAAVMPTLTDLGVFLHHTGRYAEAKRILEESVATHVEHDHVLEKALKHLHTADETKMCGCFGDVDVNMIINDVADEVDPEFILQDLFANISLDEHGNMHVNLSRSPSPQEEKLLDEYTLKTIKALDEARKQANHLRLKSSGL